MKGNARIEGFQATAAKTTRLTEEVMKLRFRIRKAFELSEGRELKRLRAMGITGGSPKSLLVEEQPRLQHTHRYNTNRRMNRGEGFRCPKGGSNLGISVPGRSSFCM